MPKHIFTQPIRQLEKRKGDTSIFKLMQQLSTNFQKKRSTRLICSMDHKISYACGLNHLGDGNFFIILSTKNLKALGKQLYDEVTFEIFEDPNPLGVEIPKVLQVYLDQDKLANQIFNKITDGMKRSLIYSIKPLKDIDKQVHRIRTFLEEEDLKLRSKKK